MQLRQALVLPSGALLSIENRLRHLYSLHFEHFLVNGCMEQNTHQTVKAHPQGRLTFGDTE